MKHWYKGRPSSHNEDAEDASKVITSLGHNRQHDFKRGRREEKRNRWVQRNEGMAMIDLIITIISPRQCSPPLLLLPNNLNYIC
jgi:hypothetical protein